MKTRLFLTAAVLGMAVATAAVAQQPNAAGANAGRYGVAVVDIGYIFKNYSQFSSSMENLKTEMKSAEGQLKAERDQVQAKEEQCKAYNPGSPEFKQLEEEIARLKAEFNLKAGKIRKDFLEREAKVYYQTYLEVSNSVKYYAQQHNIGLVLKFNGDQVDPNRREDVLRAINKPVVHQTSIDITPDVLALLNRGLSTAKRPDGATRR